MDDQHTNERQSLMTRLLDAVKQCQIRFGGRSELATEVDSRVCCLCAAWEAVMQHGLKHTNKALSTLKQVTELTGLVKIGTGFSLIDDIKNMETEPTFWQYVREHLNKQDLQRFSTMQSIDTDEGKGRAWLRASLNEHSLEKYMHMCIENLQLAGQYYEQWAFMRDIERSSMLPNMAGGLASILFAITIDNAELNSIKPASGMDSFISSALSSSQSTPTMTSAPHTWDPDPQPVIGGEGSDKRKERKKKKRIAKIVSFEDGLSSYSGSPASSVASPLSKSSSFDLGSPVTKQFPSKIVTSGFDTTKTASPETSSDIDEGSKGRADSDVSSNSSNQIHDWNAEPDNSHNALHVSEKSGSSNSAVDLSGVKRWQDVLHSEQTESHVPAPHFESTKTSFYIAADLNVVREEKKIKEKVTDVIVAKIIDQVNYGAINVTGEGHGVTEKGETLGECIVSLKEESCHNIPINVVQSKATQHDRRSPSSTEINASKCGIVPTANSLSENSSHSRDMLILNTKRDSKSGTSINTHSKEFMENVAQPQSAVIIEESETELDIPVFRQSTIYDNDSATSDTSVGEQGHNNGSPHSTPISIHQRQLPSGNSIDNGDVRSNHSFGSYSSNGDAFLGTMSADTSLMPINAHGEQVLNDSGETASTTESLDASDLIGYSKVAQNAMHAVALAQEGFLTSLRTQGDGSNTPDPFTNKQDTMTTGELKQAVIAMMMRKDEVEEQNKTLQAVLEGENERSASLQLEINDLKKSYRAKQDNDAEKIKEITRENDLLKHQLRKYVSAVQLLRKKGSESDLSGLHLESPQPAIPPVKAVIDYSHEASEYEKKLVQVAEMHGELIELNEHLQKCMRVKDNIIKCMKSELEELRGPLPQDQSFAIDTMSITSVDSEMNSRSLINVWIPSAFLRGKSSDTFHVYQVYVRIRDEEWNVYRRYSEFRDMHMKLKKAKHDVIAYDFPPKKTIGHKDAKFVEMRRKKLQNYLRKVINLVTRPPSELSTGTCKQKLVTILPFFGDQPFTDKKSKTKKRERSRSRGRGAANSASPSNTQNPEVQVYNGL